MSAAQQWPLGSLEKVEISPFIAYRGQPTGWACDCERTLPVFTWWEVCGGSARVMTARGSAVARTGEWILIPHGISRHQLIEKGTRLVSLSFRALWPNGRPVFELAAPIVGPKHAKLASLSRSLCRVLEQEGGAPSVSFTDRNASFSAWLRLRTLLFLFIDELVKCAVEKGATMVGPSAGDARLDALLSELRRNLHAGPLPYAVWNAHLGLGRSQLDRLARQHLGRSLKAVRDTFLEDELRHHFALGTLSSKELAAKYRFADAAHFSRWVRRMTGYSPKALRQKMI